MRFRFLHMADVHLGFMQYQSRERYNDFALAFEDVVQKALARKADFVLLAGDLFHKRSIDGRTLLQATRILSPLRDAGIPVLAVEGNHERAHVDEEFSWIDYLGAERFVTLLDIKYEGERLVLEPWEDGAGAYIDLPCGARVFGVHYVGGSTSRVVRDLAQAITELPGPRPAYTILMLHAGLQGVLDNYSATLARSELDALRPLVDYLALGHIHKPFAQEDWIYNPGSLETNSTTEVDWEDRGYFWVEVDAQAAPPHRVTKMRNPRRSFERLLFEVDPYETPEQMYAALERYLRQEATPARTRSQCVVEMHVTGTLLFDGADLDTQRVEKMVMEAFHPVVCQIRNTTAPTAFDIVVEERSREEIERQVIRELLERDVRRREAGNEWTELVLSLKQMALDSDSPAQIVAALRAFRQEVLGEGGGC